MFFHMLLTFFFNYMINSVSDNPSESSWEFGREFYGDLLAWKGSDYLANL